MKKHKKLIISVVSFFSICLLLTGVLLFTNYNSQVINIKTSNVTNTLQATDSSTAISEETTTAIESKSRDLTVKVEKQKLNLSNPIAIENYPPQILIQRTANWKPTHTIENLMNAIPESIEIIKGTVVNVEYTNLYNTITTFFTLSTIQVDEVIRGALNQGDLITLIESGGYTTVEHFYEVNPGGIPEGGIENPEDLVKMLSPYGEFSQVEQELLLFIYKSNGEYYPEGAYTVMGIEFPAKYVLDGDKYKRVNPLDREEILFAEFPEDQEAIEEQWNGIDKEILIEKVKRLELLNEAETLN